MTFETKRWIAVLLYAGMTVALLALAALVSSPRGLA